MSKFYTYNQNNSGGHFAFDKVSGITHLVIIEADSIDHADAIAEDIGLYWNGCDAGIDCPCCGDRWYSPYGEGTDEPSIYEMPISQYIDMADPEKLAAMQQADPEKYGKWFKTFLWMDPGYEACIHYLDGTKKWL